ncbi:hypothetical protein HOP50_11g62190 [Chloropicon primus]|uniref:YchJ-like middle NTF2-like domain-containing protein n=1 Tax=Chloropicon primus TaxID=1764295 RepID=A0A5B8MSP6_9CHLO|nr:hypothetical protein A3770_11p61970 [Chloropicon primus]UPR02892.1 hypothetical protein HOP50_11g62190 [Chloropicon primus]|eukprot:QDZ23679.1 hypothetical protein A3770_11p61970 [Chloropicon primus]
MPRRRGLRRHDLRGAPSRLLAAGFGKEGKGFGSKQSTMSKDELCPCGQEGLAYKSCCKAYHLKTRKAESPRRLLRTRFTAYAKARKGDAVLSRYLVETAVKPDSSKELEALCKDIEASCDKLQFSNLKVLEEAEHESHAVIKFSYTVRVQGQKGFNLGAPEQIEETSHFVKSDGVWYFNDSV